MAPKKNVGKIMKVCSGTGGQRRDDVEVPPPVNRAYSTTISMEPKPIMIVLQVLETAT